MDELFFPLTFHCPASYAVQAHSRLEKSMGFHEKAKIKSDN